MTQVLAHRGSAKALRENTLGAFEEASRIGADGVELDVRATADGRLVVHHDPVTEDGTTIGSSSFADLPDFVPELGDALDACGDLLVNVEVKSNPSEPGFDSYETTARLTARLCAARLERGESGPIVVSSFSLRALETMAAEGGGLELAWLVAPGSRYASRAVDVVVSSGWLGLHPFFSLVDETLVTRARGAGLALRPWTVDEPGRIVELARLGVDAVITNDVEGALAALGRR